MALHQLKRTQILPISLEKAWDFFSSPFNLKEITPPDMDFQVKLIDEKQKMYQGMIIGYKVRPLLKIPISWVTEITHVQEPYYFVDEQRFGPYSLWHHQHHFKEVDGGVEMIDLVSYKIPFGVLGDFANGLFVRKRLEYIFDYRYRLLEYIFPTTEVAKVYS
ncbi:MAG: SRPBCC family protein [Raineya sp.]|jgi:ligand-binding SRPBCC domain-containing protein|nr:SRPBCC family protein [Raineya sp.]